MGSRVQINTLVAAKEFHERRHVQRVQPVVTVHVEVLPRPIEILLHVVVIVLAFLLLVLFDDHFAGALCLLLIHVEDTVRRAIRILTL